MKKTNPFSLTLLFLGAFISVSAQTTDEIVSKHIEAVGGKENWTKVKSMRIEMTIKEEGNEVKIISTQIDRKAKRADISFTGMKGYSILTEKEGWEFMPFGGMTKPEPMTAEDIKIGQDDLQLQDEFITYKDLEKKLEYIGKDDVDGTECLKLKMTCKDARETTFYIDPANYFVIKQVEKVKVNGQEEESTSMFSNYKKIEGGIFYPMSILSDGANMEITKVEVNPTIDESIFSLPK